MTDTNLSKLAAAEGELAKAEAAAAAAEGGDMVMAGGLLAGWQARVRALRERLADGERKQAEAAQQAERERQAAEHAQAIRALTARRAEACLAWAEWGRSMLAADQAARAGWELWPKLTAERQAIFKAAQELGCPEIGNVDPGEAATEFGARISSGQATIKDRRRS